MRGRRPKPTALHLLQGTYNPTDHAARAHEPVAVGDLDRPPSWLTPAQKRSWRYAIAHAPRGLLRLIDSTTLAIWVEAEDRHRTAAMMQARLDRANEMKLVIASPGGGLVPSPYNDILDKTAKTMLRCMGELGFSPAARPRMKVSPDGDGPTTADPELDPWAALRVIPGGKDE